MNTNEAVEAVARAIALSIHLNIEDDVRACDLSADEIRHIAQAALAAARPLLFAEERERIAAEVEKRFSLSNGRRVSQAIRAAKTDGGNRAQ